MNERIKELSDIAYKNHLKNNPNSSFGRRSDYDREFAELIVKECLSIAKHVNRNPYLPDGEQARQIIKDITKNFGVEE